MQLIANQIDIVSRRISPARISVSDGRIKSIETLGKTVDEKLPYVLPGFIDAHIHIESSMLVPSEFARLATRHGTVAVVTDPHEIANVMGVQGIDFMIDNANQVPLKCYFGAPSCVPATCFETAGAEIDVESISQLLARDDIHYLAEMMNFPGVLSGDPQVMAKIAAAKAAGKPVDGHAPGLTGEAADAYIAAGISTDHECTTLNEATYKLDQGMKILIREGSAAKNFDALHPLIRQSPSQVMFCSDDKHPNDLAVGHINQIVARSIALGYDLFDVLQIACLNPIQHYQLDVGQLREGDVADFVVVDDLHNWSVRSTVINGTAVAQDGQALIASVPVEPINRFNCKRQTAISFRSIAAVGEMDSAQEHRSTMVDVIRAIDGSLVTERVSVPLRIVGDEIVADHERDVLKLTVVNRYQASRPAVAWIHGFGMKQGAIASCVAHDSHNIVAVGVDDESLTAAVNKIIDQQGGISAVAVDQFAALPLSVAGIISSQDAFTVAEEYDSIDRFAKEVCGSVLTSPFMTLSFMSLLVIPSLKLSDRGLFDGDYFNFV
ncbi:adenine deaminase [Stieleria marina]|uniref:adenine deaminase n=1 Tax=Stieleria marina TaxID=1930275 RepID=UPI003AF3ECB2